MREFDPLCDEGMLYALALMQAGVGVEFHAYPGTFHGHEVAVEAEISKRTVADTMAALALALAPARALG